MQWAYHCRGSGVSVLGDSVGRDWAAGDFVVDWWIYDVDMGAYMVTLEGVINLDSV